MVVPTVAPVHPKAWGAPAPSSTTAGGGHPNSASSGKLSSNSTEGGDVALVSIGGESPPLSNGKKMPSPTETVASTAAASSIISAFQSPVPNSKVAGAAAAASAQLSSASTTNKSAMIPSSASNSNEKLPGSAVSTQSNSKPAEPGVTGASVGTAGVPAAAREEMLRMTPQSIAPAGNDRTPMKKMYLDRDDANRERASTHMSVPPAVPTPTLQPTVMADPTKVIKPTLPYRPTPDGNAPQKQKAVNTAPWGKKL